ncbi:MAG: RdgB/HAM1 family non-canonical purine NTP pyrophosphatase [Pseudomonadota bacterium]
MNEQIVLASGNAGKLREFREILAIQDVDLRSQAEFGVSSCDETGLSFVENALLKAQNAARLTGMAAIADDSGIVVDALGGAPGIYSARYAGENASDDDNLQKLVDTFQASGSNNHACRFICLIVFITHEKDPLPRIYQGVWEGELIAEPRGDNGFGYDPIFWVPTHQCTSAELPAEVKNEISHRGQALRAFANAMTA